MLYSAVDAARLFAEAFNGKNILCIPDYSTPDVTVMYNSNPSGLPLPTTFSFTKDTSGINVFMYGIMPPGMSKEKRPVINLVCNALQRLYGEAFRHEVGDLRKDLQFRYQELPNELVVQAELTLSINPYMSRSDCVTILNKFSKIREEAMSNVLKVMNQMGVL